MVNQKSWDDAVDVDGYDHVLVNNIALSGVKGNFTQIDQTKCTIVNNSFLPYDYSPSSGDFENTTDYQQLTGPRKADGSLPDLTFLLLKKSSPLYNKQMGYQFDFKSTNYAKGILP